MSMISIDKLNYSYNSNEILKNITFKVKIPSLVTIVGSNNCGKTTLIKCLSGIMPIEESVMIDDIVLNKKNIKKYSRNIGVVFSLDQNQFLFNKVIDEILFPLGNLNFSKKKMREALNEVTKLLFLDDLLDKEVWELSNIEKIKVLIATAIIHKPKVLFVDDILVGLNDEDKERILLILKRLIRELKLIVISTTSSLSDAIYSDAILVIDNGKIKYSGKLEDILKHDNSLVKLGIDIPVMMDMSLKLQFYDLLDKVILNPEEMVDELWN
ncbi:MAG: ATP-binding cassette domain-containing protein [Bacilli bacterium]|nr:ATP-binding cassette domain-containing protein [Bacilli bacterium]